VDLVVLDDAARPARRRSSPRSATRATCGPHHLGQRSDAERIAGASNEARTTTWRSLQPRAYGRVAAILQRSRATTGGGLVISPPEPAISLAGAADVDPASRRFEVDGGSGARRRGRLTPAEFALLARCAPSGAVLTQDQLSKWSPAGPTSVRSRGRRSRRQPATEARRRPAEPWLIRDDPSDRLPPGRGQDFL
jgi:hypothetical protein